MEITIFAKKRTTAQGKVFYNYLTTLPRVDGGEDTLPVKFREDAGFPDPKECPQNIVINKDDVNIQRGKYTREDTGEVVPTKTLWVNKWKKGKPYVDHSLDDYKIE